MREPGFYPDIPEVEYHADRETLSHSGAKTIIKAPALFKWQLDHPVHKDVFDEGSAAHAVVLGIDNVYVAPFDNWMTKQAKEEKRLAREMGMAPVLPDQWLKVCDMAEALSRHDYAMSLLEGGAAEVSAYAEHEPTGVMRRCRFDYIRPGLGVDYKSSPDVSPHGFAKSVISYGYDQQADFYQAVAFELGEDIDFRFIVQSKDPPYLVEVYDLDPTFLRRGRRLNDEALDIYRRCLQSGDWPGHTGKPHTTLTPPAWVLREEAS